MQLLISGCEQNPQTKQYIKGVLMVLDTDSGRIVHQTEYRPPEDQIVPDQKVDYTGFCFIEGELYVCSHTRINVYQDWPPRNPAREISIRGFNDLHHCIPWKDGLAVSNTGLETVDHISLDGELIQRWDLLENVPEARVIDPDKDYRQIPDTKPHLRHGNHLFVLDGRLWTSQLRTFDAVCVDDQTQRLEMGQGMPHDGDVIDDQIMFTTTNGHLVCFDIQRDMARTIHDLNAIDTPYDQLGWCRGIAKVPGTANQWFVGFSELRRSKWKEFGYWVKYGHTQPKSRVAIFDLDDHTFVREYMLSADTNYQIFQFEVLPDDRCVPA